MIRRLVLFLAIISSSLFAATFEERAKHAENLLGEYKLNDAFREYTSILRELPQLSECNKDSLEFAYWIYRERSYTAFLMDDIRTMQSDIQKMKEVLASLGFSSEYGMDEYYYAIELARRGKALMERYSEPEPLSLQQPLLALSIGSWFKNLWNETKIGSEKFRGFLDESYCRLVHNEDRLEQIYAQKRAQELYYPHLIHSKQEMEYLAQSIREKDSLLWKEIKAFGWEHGIELGITGLTLAGSILSAEMGDLSRAGGTFCTFVGGSTALMYHLQKDGGPLWDKYQDLQNDRGRLTRMNLDNRQASYTRCILESRTPEVYYKSEKDTGWYAGYYFVDMNNDHFDFNLSLSKKF